MKKSLVLFSIFTILFAGCSNQNKKKRSTSIMESTSIQPTSAGDFSSSINPITAISTTLITSQISHSSSSQQPVPNQWCQFIHDAFIFALGEELPYYQPFDNQSSFSPITSTYRAAFMLSGSIAQSPLQTYNNSLVQYGWNFVEIVTDPETQAQDYVYSKNTLEARTSYYQGNFYIYALSEDNYPVEPPDVKDVLLNSDFPSSYTSASGTFSEGTWSSTNIINQNGDIQLKKDGGKLILNNVKASKLFLLFSNVSKGSPSTILVQGGNDKNSRSALQYCNGFVTINNIPYIEIYSIGVSAITFAAIASIK